MHLRGCVEVLLTGAFFSSILLLPLPDVHTIMLSAPLMITVSGALMLREQVHWKSWLAVLLGFCGVLVVMWPDDLGFQITYLLPLIATILLVVRELLTKRMMPHYRGIEVVLVTSLMTTLAGGMLTFLRNIAEFQCNPLFDMFSLHVDSRLLDGRTNHSLGSNFSYFSRALFHHHFWVIQRLSNFRRNAFNKHDSRLIDYCYQWAFRVPKKVVNFPTSYAYLFYLDNLNNFY